MFTLVLSFLLFLLYTKCCSGDPIVFGDEELVFDVPSGRPMLVKCNIKDEAFSFTDSYAHIYSVEVTDERYADVFNSIYLSIGNMTGENRAAIEVSQAPLIPSFGDCKYSTSRYDCVNGGFQLAYNTTEKSVGWYKNLSTKALLSGELILASEARHASDILFSTIYSTNMLAGSSEGCRPLVIGEKLYLHPNVGVYTKKSPKFTEEESLLEFRNGKFYINESCLWIDASGITTFGFNKVLCTTFDTARDSSGLIYCEKGLRYRVLVDENDFGLIKVQQINFDMDQFKPLSKYSQIFYSKADGCFYSSQGEHRIEIRLKDVVPDGENCIDMEIDEKTARQSIVYRCCDFFDHEAGENFHYSDIFTIRHDGITVRTMKGDNYQLMVAEDGDFISFKKVTL